MNSKDFIIKNSRCELKENQKSTELNSMDYNQFKQTFMSLANELSDLKKMVVFIGKNRLAKTMENWVDGEEVQKALKISKRTLQSYRDKGVLGYTQFGNKLFYKVSEIEKLLEEKYKKH